MVFLQERQGLGPAIDRDDLVTRVLERPGQIGAHGVFVFGQQDADHDPVRVSAVRAAHPPASAHLDQRRVKILAEISGWPTLTQARRTVQQWRMDNRAIRSRRFAASRRRSQFPDRRALTPCHHRAGAIRHPRADRGAACRARLYRVACWNACAIPASPRCRLEDRYVDLLAEGRRPGDRRDPADRPCAARDDRSQPVARRYRLGHVRSRHARRCRQLHARPARAQRPWTDSAPPARDRRAVEAPPRRGRSVRADLGHPRTLSCQPDGGTGRLARALGGGAAARPAFDAAAGAARRPAAARIRAGRPLRRGLQRRPGRLGCSPISPKCGAVPRTTGPMPAAMCSNAMPRRAWACMRSSSKSIAAAISICALAEPGDGFAAMAQLLTGLVRRLAAEVAALGRLNAPSDWAEAAE